jgi:hypothetical protein
MVDGAHEKIIGLRACPSQNIKELAEELPLEVSGDAILRERILPQRVADEILHRPTGHLSQENRADTITVMISLEIASIAHLIALRQSHIELIDWDSIVRDLPTVGFSDSEPELSNSKDHTVGDLSTQVDCGAHKSLVEVQVEETREPSPHESTEITKVANVDPKIVELDREVNPITIGQWTSVLTTTE